jgi:ABC-2 type transport system ATP-binding protein
MIEVENLSKIYGSTPAIHDINFSVDRGEIVGFLGPNGAGKTTTMRILSAYIPATAGTAKIAGHDVHEESIAVRQAIGYLPETPPLYHDMTVEGFLYFVARIKGVSPSDRRDRVNWSIERCQLSEKRKVLIHKLSKGYRQRVGIAQAIVHDPPVIILDEPTVGLDPKQISQVRELIKSLAGEHTIILSTHILPEVSMTCDRVIIINRGKVVATDTPDNLMSELTGASGYELEVDGDVRELGPLLAQIAGVSQLEIRVKDKQGNNARYLLDITTEAGQEPGPEIASTIINQGLGLYEMRSTRPTLEDVFLDLVTDEPEINQGQLTINNDNDYR